MSESSETDARLSAIEQRLAELAELVAFLYDLEANQYLQCSIGRYELLRRKAHEVAKGGAMKAVAPQTARTIWSERRFPR